MNPMPQSAWPTLGSMIDSGKRVVVFLDAGADGSDGGVVPYILPEFTMVSMLGIFTPNPNLIDGKPDLGNAIRLHRCLIPVLRRPH